jgi:curli biogenesis system outer membrane secretion channel CsgG
MAGRWLLSIGTAAALAAPPAFAEHVAYVGADRKPLPEKIDDFPAEQLVNLEWGAYSGRRATVAVLEVENNTSLASYIVTSSSTGAEALTSVPVNGIEAIITDTLNRTGRFRLVERQQTALQGVLQEQDFAASGRVTQESGAKTGNILGAEYLVQFVINDYQPDTSGKTIKVGGLLKDKVPSLAGLNVQKRTSRVDMNLRLINSETSEIIFTKQIDSVIKESGLVFDGSVAGDDLGLSGFLSNFSQTPLGQATIAGVNEGVYEVIKKIGSRPTEGSVVTVNANQIVVNLGAAFTEVGERFQTIRRGESLIDPDTGLSLGNMESTLGELEIVSVQEKFSVARLASGQAPARGDKIVSTKAPPPLEFGPPWSGE